VSRRRFKCLDCGVDTGKIGQFYMLHDKVWLSVVDGREGMLCVPHVEARLGRQLTAEDFTNAYINNIKWGVKASILVSRIIDTDLGGAH
jgi:hypothetical protein